MISKSICFGIRKSYITCPAASHRPRLLERSVGPIKHLHGNGNLYRLKHEYGDIRIVELPSDYVSETPSGSTAGNTFASAAEVEIHQLPRDKCLLQLKVCYDPSSSRIDCISVFETHTVFYLKFLSFRTLQQNRDERICRARRHQALQAASLKVSPFSVKNLFIWLNNLSLLSENQSSSCSTIRA